MRIAEKVKDVGENADKLPANASIVWEQDQLTSTSPTAISQITTSQVCKYIFSMNAPVSPSLLIPHCLFADI